jgi:hypothetical protein
MIGVMRKHSGETSIYCPAHAHLEKSAQGIFSLIDEIDKIRFIEQGGGLY